MVDEPRYASLTEAMQAGDELAEAQMRYGELDKTFVEAAPRERKSLSVELNALMEKITRLRAQQNPDAETGTDPRWGQVVAIDDRFQRGADRKESR